MLATCTVLTLDLTALIIFGEGYKLLASLGFEAFAAVIMKSSSF
jgi:hypothetical protein